MTEPEYVEPDQAEQPEPESEPSPESESAVTQSSGRGRGRPRARETLDRDERVLSALASGPLTRELLAEKLGEPSSLVYLALWRLARQTPPRVERVADHSTRNAWQLVS